ncbi:MAG: hypothetical protein JW767_05375 [Thermoleophilia bacterium]|nr:hypothetical protein [Thermoleophilia bacterium]
MRLAIVAVTLVTLVVLTVAASALAVTSSNTQSSPGIHQRTIWDQTQVMIRRLTPVNTPGVNHTGYIHLELKFKPTTSDFDLYLLDAEGNLLTAEMGCMGIFAGKEYVDYQVEDVGNQNIVSYINPYTYEFVEYMEGDVYYVVVVAFNGFAEYQLWGYYPQIALDLSDDVYDSSTYYLQQYRYPSSVTKWGKLTGPRYGGPYDFRPTSAGEGACRLEWPADVVNKVVTYDPVAAPMPFCVEQYLYAGAYWDLVLANWAPEGSEENYLPPLWEEDPLDLADDWYGFYDTYPVAVSAWEDDLWAQRIAHYVPSLFLAYADPLLGPDGGLDTGRSTMGFKATLTWPENLWLRKVVKYSSYYKIYGRYSLDGAAVEIGTPVEIWRKTSTSGWRYVKTVKTYNDAGAWSVKLSPGRTWTIEARAEGNPSTGLDIEKSIRKVLKGL